MTSAELSTALRTVLAPYAARTFIEVRPGYAERGLGAMTGTVFVSFASAPPGASSLDIWNARESFVLVLEAPEWSVPASEVRVARGRTKDVSVHSVSVKSIRGRTRVRAMTGSPEKSIEYVKQLVARAENVGAGARFKST